MPKTFDPGTFDIHEFEETKPAVYPTSTTEKIDPRTLEGISQEPETKKPKKRVFAALVGNVLLPGLGNVIIKRTVLGGALLLLNLLFLAMTASPVSVLGFLGNMAYPRMPTALDYAVIGVAEEPNAIALRPEMLPIFYITVAIAFLAWLHFFYLLTTTKAPK